MGRNDQDNHRAGACRCIAALPGAGYAAGVATEACAGEAASPYQKGFGKTGKEDFEVDVEAVISQCESALLIGPGFS